MRWYCVLRHNCTPHTRRQVMQRQLEVALGREANARAEVRSVVQSCTLGSILLACVSMKTEVVQMHCLSHAFNAPSQISGFRAELAASLDANRRVLHTSSRTR